MRNKKIIILGNIPSMMLIFREELIQDLVEEGVEVFCMAEGYTEEDMKVLTSWGAIAVESPLKARGLNPFKDILAVFKLVRIIKDIRPDVMFTFFVKPVLFGSLAAKIAKVPRVVGMIEGLGNAFTNHKQFVSLKTKFVKAMQVFLYKFILPKIDALILLNKDDKKDLIDAYNIVIKNLAILGPIGIDLDKYKYSPAPISPVSFIFIGRFLREKGIFEYLEAAEIIKKRYPDTVFYLLGGFDKGNPFALKEEDLDSYLKGGIVEYPGFVNNVAEWLAKSSVSSSSSSYREGFPRVAQEASAIGRPIITTDSVGCRETVEDGKTGFLIPLFDVNALVKKMEFFINNPDEVNKMGIESRKIAEEKYDVFEINKRLMKILFDS